jgi:hypothetical protein
LLAVAANSLDCVAHGRRKARELLRGMAIAPAIHQRTLWPRCHHRRHVAP